MNEFESSWSTASSAGHAAGRFRVYPDHLLNFYIQYSLAGRREVVIEVFADEIPMFELPAFRNLELVKLQIPGGVRIGMTLVDGDLARSFSVMCYDLAERSRPADTTVSALSTLLRALNNWADLFRKRTAEGLSREEVLGLVGELLVVEALVESSRGSVDALIQGWRGPHGDARDIGFNGTRIEVKAQRSTSALKLRVSSLAQLDDRGDRVFVVLIRLSPSESGRSLMELADSLRVRLEGFPMASIEFERKLETSGMTAESDHAHERLSQDERLVFFVAEQFPRLVPGNVPAGVTAVSYEVSGPPLEAFRTSWSVLMGAIDGRP